MIRKSKIFPIVFLLAFTVSFLPFALRAQKMTLSPEALDNGGLNFMKIIGQDDAGVFVLFSNLSLGTDRDRVGLKLRRYRLGYFTFDLKPRWQQNLEAQDENADIETVSFFDDRVLVITSLSDKNKGSIDFYLETYTASGKSNTIKKAGTLSVSKLSAAGKPRVRSSPDKKLFALIVSEELENTQQLHSWICDQQLNVVGTFKSQFDYSVRDLDLTEVLLTDDRQLAALGQLRAKDAANDRKKTRFYRLFLIGGNGAPKEYPVNTVNELMSEASLTIDRKNKNILVTGFYAENGSFAGTGILYGRINPAMPDSFRIATIPIRSDSHQKLVGERNNSNGVGLYNYPIQKIILRNDGGAVVVAEAAYLSEYSYYDYFTQSFNRRIEYHFDNIIVLSVNSRGNIDWSEVIQKEQVSMDDEGYYSSFCAMYDPDRMALVFNDDIGRNNMVVSHIIDNMGRLQVKKLSGISDNTTLIPKAGKQVAESLIIVPATSRKRLYLARIEF